jgi:hypothetical protein
MHDYSLGTIPLGFRQGVPEKTASVEGACRRTRSFALYRPHLLDNLLIDTRQANSAAGEQAFGNCSAAQKAGYHSLKCMSESCEVAGL